MSRPSVALLDYGSGNIRSVERALARAGGDVVVTTERSVVTVTSPPARVSARSTERMLPDP